ncbi:MAG: hypothetical protein WCJ67_08850 [Thermoleophilia bacterium]
MIWFALGVLLVAVVGGVSYATLRGFQLTRDLKRGGAALASEIDRVSAASLRIDRQMMKAETATRRLHDATGRLTTSWMQLGLQCAAVRQAHAQMRRVFWFVPGI